MEALAELLEQELEEAVEVKNRKSLHRYITLLTSNYLKKETHEEPLERVFGELRDMKSDIRLIAERMEIQQKRTDDRFEEVNRHFNDVNKRFDDVNKRFDDVNKRFDDVNKRFDDVNKRFGLMTFFMSLGFVVISLLVTVFPRLFS